MVAHIFKMISTTYLSDLLYTSDQSETSQDNCNTWRRTALKDYKDETGTWPAEGEAEAWGWTQGRSSHTRFD